MILNKRGPGDEIRRKNSRQVIRSHDRQSHTQPIIANVDGEILEVWVEQHNGITRIISQESAQNEADTPDHRPVHFQQWQNS